jgi:hypothetical protein
LVFCILALFSSARADEYLSSLETQVDRLARAAGEDQGRWLDETAKQCRQEDTQCLVGRYSERRLALIDGVRKAALARAPESRSGPYAFRDLDIRLGAKISISYPVMTAPPEVAAAFNDIAQPWTKAFLDPCEEQSLKVGIGLATEKMITLRTRFSTRCEGAREYDSESGTTIVMRPRPHLLGPADLFRPDAPWRAVLAGAVGGEHGRARIATDPHSWLATPAGLKIQFGYLNGYEAGQVEAEIPWEKLADIVVVDPPFRQ